MLCIFLLNVLLHVAPKKRKTENMGEQRVALEVSRHVDPPKLNAQDRECLQIFAEPV